MKNEKVAKGRIIGLAGRFHTIGWHSLGKKSKTIFDFWLMLEKRGFQFLLETENSLDNSGIQWDHAKGSIVKLWRIFQKKISGVKNPENLNFCVFIPIWVKFDMQDNIPD